MIAISCFVRGNSKIVNANNRTPIIELHSIIKSFDNSTIIKNISLNINNGEFLTILGPSGCGKTTILRLIAGFESVDSGKIILDGQDITKVEAEDRHVNTVFQSYALFPHMNVFENIAFGLRMKKIAPDEINTRVNEVLKTVRLEQYAKRKPSQLSGGQQQRVAIARALVNKPKVLLLDESLSALDYNLRKQMQNELKALQRQLGITFIFVTHDQEEALSMSDRIVVLKEGEVAQDGSPREIYEEPNSLFVADFIGEINVFDAEVIRQIDANSLEATVEGRVCKISVKHPYPVGKKLKVLLRPEDLRLEEVSDKNLNNQDLGIIGHVIERNYKGMTLDSTVQLLNGKIVLVSEFFNEDDPDVDHSLNQQVAVTWVESWEWVLDENNEL